MLLLDVVTSLQKNIKYLHTVNILSPCHADIIPFLCIVVRLHFTEQAALLLSCNVFQATLG